MIKKSFYAPFFTVIFTVLCGFCMHLNAAILSTEVATKLGVSPQATSQTILNIDRTTYFKLSPLEKDKALEKAYHAAREKWFTDQKVFLAITAAYNELKGKQKVKLDQAQERSKLSGRSDFDKAIECIDKNLLPAFQGLLEKNSSLISAVDVSEKTLLHWAVQYKRTDFVQELLWQEANPNVQDVQGNTPLHYAAAYCNDPRAQRDAKNLIDVLLNSSANRSIKNNEGKTPIDLIIDPKMKSFIASFFSKTLVAMNLIENNEVEELEAHVKSNRNAVTAIFDAHGNTLLHLVALHMNAQTGILDPVNTIPVFQMIEILLMAGALNTVENNSGKTPAQLAKDTAIAQYIQQENPWERKKIYLRWLLTQFKKEPMPFFRPLLGALADLVGISGALKWMWKTVTRQ